MCHQHCMFHFVCLRVAVFFQTQCESDVTICFPVQVEQPVVDTLK